MNIDELQNLLDNLPERKIKNPTFFEITKYPHYENVCSNLLQFFLDPQSQVHQLGDIMLQSFFDVLKYEKNLVVDSSVKIKREFSTNTGRIDLVIVSAKWVLAIENKIFHTANNGFEEYSQCLETCYSNKQIIKVLLSIRKEQNISGGFINITYEDLIHQIDKKISTAAIDNTHEYSILFHHFIKTLKNLYQRTPMEKKEIEFVIKNNEKIEHLINLKTQLDSYFKDKAKEILESLIISPQIEQKTYEEPGLIDLVFRLKTKYGEFKLECPMSIQNESIFISIRSDDNKVDFKSLNKLAIFEKRKAEDFETGIEGDLLTLESNIDLLVDNRILVDKLNYYLNLFKVI